MVSDQVLSYLSESLEHLELRDLRSRSVGVNRCHRSQCLTRMAIGIPTLMIPVIGTKRIVAAQHRIEASPGEFLILPPGVEIDIDNLPDLQQSRFASALLIFDPQTMELFGKLYGNHLEEWHTYPQWKAKGTNELYSAITDWIEHTRKYPAEVIQTRHRMAELLLLLARLGFAGNLLFQKQTRLRERVRHLLALDPGKSWCAADLTDRLGMSQSTLRRQLRIEGTHFRDLLEEVRLERGIDLVMATDMPISQIAFDCGYQSQSRFAERFRKRFSLSPTELRATQARPPAVVVSLDGKRAAC